jgi:hypothetical protein
MKEKEKEKKTNLMSIQIQLQKIAISLRAFLISFHVTRVFKEAMFKDVQMFFMSDIFVFRLHVTCIS